MIKISLLIFLFSIGCAGKNIRRVESDFKIDLSGRWNATDSRLVAEQIIDEILSGKWYRKYKKQHLRNPVLIVGSIRNKTMEHINTETFVKDIERAMLNSGKIDIVASKSERQEVREERKEMLQWASIQSIKEFGAETGADFILKGVLNSIVDEEGGKKVVFYQTDISLINIENNIIAWTGQKEIKKFIKRPLFKF